jgi:uncharacterized protein YneF (UPF0154 family)
MIAAQYSAQESLDSQLKAHSHTTNERLQSLMIDLANKPSQEAINILKAEIARLADDFDFRTRKIETDRILIERGRQEINDQIQHISCTSSAIENR